MQDGGSMKPLTQKQMLALSILSAIILLSLIPAIRFAANKPILPGDTPYYHLRMANHIKESGIPLQDPLIQRPYSLQPYHLISSLTTSILIPWLCGLLSIILFYLILKQLNIESFNISIILLVLILSPLFIFLFSTSNQYAVTITLMLLGFLLFTKEKYYFIPSFIIFAIMPFFGILPSVISILLLLVYSLNNHEKLKYFYTTLAAIIIIFLAYQLPFIYHYGLPHTTRFIQKNILTSLISDLGSNAGFGIFNLLLALIGLYTIWKIKKQITAYLLLFFLILASIYIPQINIYLSFVLAIFAGYGFTSIIKMRWKIDLIKTLTIILIICGLLFSTLSYINRLSNAPPTNEIIKSLIWLKENSATTDTVFSHYSKGLWIEAFSQRAVILDSQTPYIQDLHIRFNDSNTTFYSRDLETTKQILNKYNVKYIYIDEEMKQGQVWTREQEGLLFLFRNSETFKKRYSKDNIEVWEYLG
jgi:hypothetical protein